MDSFSVEHGGVIRLRVLGLLGQFNYDLSATNSHGAANRLVILYGDNGSGKTTILKLLYSLLSDHNDQGNRALIGQIRFNLFEVELANGTVCSARRPEGETTGNYMLSIRQNGLPVFEGFVEIDAEGKVREGNIATDEYLAVLHESKLNLVLVPDNRRFKASLRLTEQIGDTITRRPTFRTEGETRTTITRRHPDRDIALTDQVVRMFDDRIRKEVFVSSRTAERDGNSIYVTIARELANATVNHDEQQETFYKTVAKINELVSRAEGFAKFRLISDTGLDKLLEIFIGAPDRAKLNVARVLEPFIESMQARMRALEPVRSLLERFLTELNGYFYGKKIDFRFGKGITIRASNGERIYPSQLSSGERQLLLLFCSLSLFNSQRTILILDEPEISLNIKWQRKLLSSLLNLSESNRNQLIIASHSIELITPHADSVWELTS